MQLGLFDPPAAVSVEDAILYALGEFQARGHKLADRELALDRLRHAVDRACDRFRVEVLPDQALASALEEIGAKVVEIPEYFAKHPYRVTVPSPLASTAMNVYHQMNGKLS